MVKKILQYCSIVVLVALLAAAVVWSRGELDSGVCRGVKVRIVNEDSIMFVTKKGILKEITDMNISPVGEKLSKIDTEEIEKRLSKSEYIESVECYIDNSNTFVIEVSQLVPVMRVFDNGNSYYVNRAGKRMSARGRYHIDVPIVNGHFEGGLQPTILLPIIDYVATDDALSSLVSMYEVRDSSNICFVPSICGHVVNLGNNKDVKSKFEKLMLFYRKVMPEKGWNTYDEVSLKWDYRVVATKKNHTKLVEEEYNPEEDEIAPDPASIQVDEIQREMKNQSSNSGKVAESKPAAENAKAKAAAGSASDKQQKKAETKTKPAADKGKSASDRVKDKFKKK